MSEQDYLMAKKGRGREDNKYTPMRGLNRTSI